MVSHKSLKTWSHSISNAFGEDRIQSSPTGGIHGWEGCEAEDCHQNGDAKQR